MDSNNDIYEAAEFCRTLFHSVTLSVSQKNPDRVIFLRSAQTDFNLWCSAIKATSKGKDSLDYRLRNHEDARKAICNLLIGLKASLKKYERSVVELTVDIEGKDSLEDHPAVPDSPSSTGSYVSWEAISEEARSEDVPTDEHNTVPDANPFVAESVLFITTTLDQLARFSLAIRKAGNKFRFARVDKEPKADSLELAQFRDHLTLVILKGFPDPDPEAPLEDKMGRASDPKRMTAVQRRLIDANVLRRHRIEYITKSRREHREQRSLPGEGDLREDSRVPADAESPRPVPAARSIMSTGLQISSIPQPEKQMMQPAARTATDIESRVHVGGSPSHPVKSTVTNLTRVAAVQAYPRSPESKLCPYCGDVLVLPPKEKRAAREQSWRAHVCQDVLPYTCFIEGCTASPEPPEMFLTSEALLAHLIEKHSSISWICDFCSSNDGFTGQAAVFETSESWGKHMEEEHGDFVKAHQRQVLADLNQQSMIGPFSCPLCDRIKTPTLDFKIDDHILGHLHEFALRALPASYENGSDDLGSALQSRGSLSRTTNADAPDDKPGLASLDDLGFGIMNVIAISDILLKNFSGMQDLQDRWLQVVKYQRNAPTKVDQEFFYTHLPRLQQAITVYLQQKQEATTDSDESMLKNIKDITDELFNYELERSADWFPNEPSLTKARVQLNELIAVNLRDQNGICPSNTAPPVQGQLTGRDNILDDLESKLLEQRRSFHLGDKHQPQGQLRIALEGGPGVGKTAIAAEVARRLHTDDSCDFVVFWVDASSAASLEKAYRDIYFAIREPQGPLSDPVHRLMYWLNWGLPRQWLMVLDGAQEQTLLYMAFMGFIPSGVNGSLLFTTRDASWQSILGPSPFKSIIKVHRISTLGDELRGAYRRTESKERSEFLPVDALDRIITHERIREEIVKLSRKSQHDADQGARLLLGSSNRPGQISSWKKMFAILALIDKLETIWDFVRQDVSDIDLPLKKTFDFRGRPRERRPILLRRSGYGRESARLIPIEAFDDWTDDEIMNLERTQWEVCGFIVCFNNKETPEARH